MKNFFLFIIPIYLFSAPSGNPSFPSTIEEGFLIPDTKPVNIRLGYQISNTSDLLLKFTDQLKEEGYHLNKVKSFCNAGVFTLNIKERLDIYLEMGSFRIEPQFTTNNNFYITKSENDILYRPGAKLILFEVSDFSIGADAKYGYFKSHSNYLTENGKPLDEDLKFLYKEWQISIGLSEKISILRPYIGISYRDSQIKINSFFQEKLKMIYKKREGLFLGSSISLGSYVFLNIEIRLVNERSTTISADVRF